MPRSACLFDLLTVSFLPFLVGQNITSNLLLLALDEVDIGEHTVLFERRGKFSCRVRLSGRIQEKRMTVVYLLSQRRYVDQQARLTEARNCTEMSVAVPPTDRFISPLLCQIPHKVLQVSVFMEGQYKHVRRSGRALPEKPCFDQLKLGLRLYTNHLNDKMNKLKIFVKKFR